MHNITLDNAMQLQYEPKEWIERMELTDYESQFLLNPFRFEMDPSP